MSEDDRVGNLHHGRFHVEGEKNVLLEGLVQLLGEKRAQGVAIHYGSVYHFAFKQLESLLEGFAFSGGVDEFDLYRRVLLDDYGFFASVKVSRSHVRDVRLRFACPWAHGVRILLGIFLDRFGYPAVGIAFP